MIILLLNCLEILIQTDDVVVENQQYRGLHHLNVVERALTCLRGRHRQGHGQQATDVMALV